VSTKDGERKGDCGSGVFIAEETDGVDDTTNVDIQTPVENLQAWDYFLQLWNSQDFWSISIQIKGILL
jgi:hypothetical protein